VIYCFACALPGHMSNECALNRDTFDPSVDPRRVCVTCRKRGHIFSNCPQQKGN
jgi:hypothetical protein